MIGYGFQIFCVLVIIIILISLYLLVVPEVQDNIKLHKHNTPYTNE